MNLFNLNSNHFKTLIDTTIYIKTQLNINIKKHTYEVSCSHRYAKNQLFIF